MKSTKLITWLFEQYQTINEKVGNINCGGCGIFAEKLFILLINLGLKPKLIVLTENKKGMDDRILNNNYRAYITHIVIKLGNRYIDSLGLYKTIDEIRLKHGYSIWECRISTKLTLDKLKEWNKDAGIWNRKFDRNHIKTIEKKLNECYKKAEKVLVVSN